MQLSPGRVAVCNDLPEVGDRAIDNYVKNLLRKIQTVEPDNDLIVSVFGVGYRFDALLDRCALAGRREARLM